MVEKQTKPVSRKGATAKSVSATAKLPKSSGKPAAIQKLASGSATARTPAVKKTSSAAVPAPAVKTRAVRKTASGATAAATARKTTAKRDSTTRATIRSSRKAVPTADERYLMVQTAAYFIAERNGFSGNPAEHWAEAELEIAAKVGV